MAEDNPEFYEYRYTDADDRDVYLCIDCGCNEEEPITDLNEHEQWHADHPHAGKRQTVADLAELFTDDEYWLRHDERPAVGPMSRTGVLRVPRIQPGVDENDVPWPSRCGLYTPGHHVHWMPGLKVANDRAREPSWEGLVARQDGIWLTVEAQYGTSRRFAQHDPERLAAALLLSEGWVLVNDAYKLIRTTGYYFGVTTEELTPCEWG
jgi:hypothetical protein